MRLLIQEQHVPGTNLVEKVPVARQWGFDGFELRGQAEFALKKRMHELQEARDEGGYFPTVCPEMSYFIGDFDSEKRRDAVTQLMSMLDVTAEFGGTGVMTPAAWGLFSKRLPPFTPPRSAQEDHDVLVEGFSEVAQHAAELGQKVFIEPLNRYEDHMINSLEDGIRLIEDVDNPAFQLVCDTYHMNIEEADPLSSLERALPYLGHVQLSDSNRFEPGVGHVDFASIINLLTSNGYEGDLAYESQLSGRAEEVLPRSSAIIRSLMG